MWGYNNDSAVYGLGVSDVGGTVKGLLAGAIMVTNEEGLCEEGCFASMLSTTATCNIQACSAQPCVDCS
jgi:hypothetical protein